MKRRLFPLAATVSLMLCLATVGLWVRSHLIGDYLRWYRPPRIVEVLSNDGLLRVNWGDLWSRDYAPASGWEGSMWPFRRILGTYRADLRRGTTLGFGYERWRRDLPTLTADGRLVTVPYWAIAALLAAPPLVTGWAWHRARRQRNGTVCPTCGYDLRATPDRCPECGTVAAADRGEGASPSRPA